ncbi:MAG TPA: TerB family tellurite resistance protein [Gammaproteobacteria bacterium]|nr:TerB family tellurite resistance protein [Gammaproteobacteria bacterium]
MLSAIKEFFGARIDPPGPGGHDEHQLQLATAALLFEMLRADHHTDEREFQAIEHCLREVFSLSPAETGELAGLARRASEESISLHPFTRLINERFSAPDKVRVVEMLWRVAFADGRLDRYEEALVRKLADLLYVPHRDFIRARHRVEESLG